MGIVWRSVCRRIGVDDVEAERPELFANAGWAMVGQAAMGNVAEFCTEFGTEINRKQGVK